VRLAFLALAFGFAGTAACSGGGSPAAIPGRNQTQLTAYHLFLRYAQCAREHGAPDWPDPIYGADGNVDFPANTPGLSHLPQSARDACDPILNDLPANARIGQPSARPDLPMLRRFAQCMRGQPQLADWPDPDGNGTFRLPADLVGKNGPRQAQFLAARTACARFNPSGQLQLAGQ
jgi:hypothetical protein